MTKNDAQSRKQIVSDFEHTLFVEAGAGSGKTTAMVARIMMALLKGLADIREIVAITFTNEGAASLKNKIQHDLETASADGVYEPIDGLTVKMTQFEKENIARALSHLSLAQFSTIHSFCMSLLKERPVEAGIDPHFELNTEGVVQSAFDGAWIRFILASAAERAPFLSFALREGVNLDEVKDIAERKCANPDLELYTERTSHITEQELDGILKSMLAIAGAMMDQIGVIEKDRVSKARERRLDFVRNLLPAGRSCKSFSDKLAFVLEHPFLGEGEWPGKLDYFREPSIELGKLREALARRRLDYLHFEIAAFVTAFEHFFAKYKKDNSALDFSDLLFLTRETLKNNSEVREYFKGRFKYIFVDETQDFDPLQMEILFFLAEQSGGFASDWRKATLVPSKLFMVGDPKQSIYRFRRADITIYAEAKEAVKRLGGEILNLDTNFRSSKAIIDFVNAHFVESFEGLRRGIDLTLHPEYAKLSAFSPRKNHLATNIFFLEAPDPSGGSSKPDQLASEIQKISSFIREITEERGPRLTDTESGNERAVQYSDIMVLLKTFTGVGEYSRAFEAAGIPHYEVGGRTFFESEEIRALSFALKAIDDPTDTISLFGALKYPAFGFDDKMLYDFISSGYRLSIWSDGNPSEGPLPVALRLFRELHTSREILRPSGVLKSLFDATGACHLGLQDPNGLQKSSKYFRLLELLHEIESNRSLSFRAVVASLAEVMDTDDPKLANLSISNSGSNAVKISTIQRAKGLEAPVVILAGSQISDFKVKSPSTLDLRTEGKILIPYNDIGGYYAKSPEILLESEQLKENCEAERLRYVAATRARDILAICIPSTEVKQDTFTGKFASSLRKSKDAAAFVGKAARITNPTAGESIKVGRDFVNGKALRDARISDLKRSITLLSTPFQSVHKAMQINPSLFGSESRKSRGTSYGLVLHRIMQNYILNESFDIDAMLDTWMEEENVGRTLRPDLVKAFEGVKDNAYVKAAKASQERYCEWEYFLNNDDHIVNGVIDLAFRATSGNWVIVDYKTDDVSDPRRKSELDSMYNKQLAFYKAAFETIGHTLVEETVLLYTEGLSPKEPMT